MSTERDDGVDQTRSHAVASTSAVTLDMPAPASVMTAPNKTLVDELMNARRERYRHIRLNQGSEHCHVFPLHSKKDSNGNNERHSSTAPPQIGLIESVQAESQEQGNEKLQGQSTAHLLLRVLSLSYIVPLCDATDAGLPDNLIRQGYSVQDAVKFMRGLLKEQTGIIEHTFKSRSDHRQIASASPFESTTLEIWLIPRILTAAAVLSMRCSESSATDSRKYEQLRTSLMQLGYELVRTSLHSTKQGPNVRLLLLECLKASLRAIAHAGRPSFLPSSVPPVSLVPKPDDHANLVSFFMREEGPIYRHLGKRYGEGINRLWMKEDQTTFQPDVHLASPADETYFARVFLLLSCQLCSELANAFPTELYDIGNTSIALLSSNWQWDMLLDQRLFAGRILPDVLDALRIDIVSSIISTSALSKFPTTPTIERLSILIVKQAMRVFIEELSVAPIVIYALQAAIKFMRSSLRESSNDSMANIKPCLGKLVLEITIDHEARSEEISKDSRIQMQEIRNLALELLLLLFNQDSDPRMLLSDKERKLLLDAFGRLSTSVGREDRLKWINDEQEDALIKLINMILAPKDELQMTPKSDEPIIISLAQYLDRKGAGNVNLRDVEKDLFMDSTLSGHLFCSSAETLQDMNGVLTCTVCDAQSSLESEPTTQICHFTGIPSIQRLLHTTVKIFSTIQFSTKRREAALHVLFRRINHGKPEEVTRDVIKQEMCHLIRLGLTDKHRPSRIMIGRLTAVFITKYSQTGVNMLASVRTRLEPLFAVYRDALQFGNARAKEAALLGLARLGHNPHSDVQSQTLLLLILQLGADSLQKSMAYTIIVQLANYHKLTVYQLLAPFLDIVSVELIERIHSSPTLFLEMLQLTNQNQSKFLQSTLQFTLPRVLEMNNEKTLSLIARGIGQDIQTMCFTSTPAILKYFLMQPPMRRDQGINTFIETIRGDGTHDINLRSLLKSYFVELLGHLVIRLGDPGQKKAALAGLHHMNSSLNDRQGVNKSTASKDMSLSAFLKDEILAILSWINDDLLNAHGKTTIVHKHMVAESIGALVDVIGQSISIVTPQLMATMNTIMQVKELMLPTLRSWHTFITKLGYAVVGPFIGQTAAALAASWPRFGPSEKEIASRILSYIVKDSMAELKPFLLQDFPNLEELRGDIPDICDKLAAIGSSTAKKPEQRLQHILDRAANENTSICGQALAELKTFLNREKAYVQRITSGNTFDPIIGKIIHILFVTVARDDETETLRDLCLENLGILGAIDPDRFKQERVDQVNSLLQDFNDKDEIGDFAMHLVRDVLITAFKATNDTKHQAALAYAIQELLKLAGFTSALLAQNGSYISNRGATVSLRVRQRWSKLPTAMLDTIAPLLESKYSVHLGDVSDREKPIYLNSSSYKDWMQHWTNQLIINVTGDHAKAMFGIFRSVIRDHDLSIAQYILPHLVLNILVLGTEEQSQELRDELVAVLEDQVNPSTIYEPERRLLSAQVIFGLFDHVSVWMRTRTQHRQKQSRRLQGEIDAAVARVGSLMSTISQELMAIASLKCRAYARSLLNFEQRIRTLRSQGKEDSDLQEHYENMHLIYANLDEPDGMEGISTRVVSPSLEHQIREHESTGRWTSAQSCWEVKIQEKPDDLDLHLGLLRCLRNLGHYDTMRTHVRGVLAVHPQWETMVDSFYVEGCCILSDWEEVKKRLAKEGNAQISPPHATARVLLAMHEGDRDAFKTAMRDARSLLGKPLIAAGKNSYVSVYDSVTQLHMLHELGMIGEALGVSTLTPFASSQVKISELSKALESRLDATLPSFRTREPLLSVRRSAFSTRNRDEFQAEIGQSWISSSKIARRTGHIQSAYSAAMQASQWKAPFAFVQKAKLLALSDNSQGALQELNNNIHTIQFSNTDGMNETTNREALANAFLFTARLLNQAGRSRPNVLIEQYKTCTTMHPRSEKMSYYLGHYYDQGSDLTQSNNLPVANVFVQHNYTCKYLLRSAAFGTKFFYRSLPRVLTIWFDCGEDQSILMAQKLKAQGKSIDSDTESKVNAFRTMNELVRRFIRKLTAYQWLAVFPQMVSRIVHKNDMVWKTLIEVICHVAEAYPHQAMWTMIAGSQSKDSERKKRFNEIVARIKSNSKANPSVNKIVDQTLRIAKELLYLCDFPVQKETQLNLAINFPRLKSLANGDLILPLQSSISVKMPGDYKIDTDHRPFEKDLPRIVDFDPKIDVMNSLQKPRKLIILASDGKQYPFLCKPKDDLRKDARLMEFDSMINNLLQSDSESRKRRLYIRTYSVVTLNEECGLIEWVPNTVGLRNILVKLYHSRDIPIYTSEVQKNLDKARANPRNAGEIFEKLVLSNYPPVFHEWFVASFPEPSAWLRARLAYAHTLAVMSMVGHVLGLGDRHGENILFDSESGDVVHVDLNCLFDKALQFEIPERVPFRLTHNLVDALGVTGYEGVFRRTAEISMNIVRDNKDSLMSVLEAMVHDPLGEWGTDDRGKTKAANRPDPRLIQARNSLDPVKQKLNGKIRTTNGWSSAYTTNALVDALILSATDNSLLGQMYAGWSAYC